MDLVAGEAPWMDRSRVWMGRRVLDCGKQLYSKHGLQKLRADAKFYFSI